MKRHAFLVLVLALFYLGGCGDDTEPPGSISVNWLIGTSGCTASEVTTVVIALDSVDPKLDSTHTYQCSDGQAVISDLVPGSYDVTLTGRGADERARYGAEVPGAVVRSNGTTQLGTIRLNAYPASLMVTWFFANSRMCSANNVAGITVSLFDEEDYLKYSMDVTCEGGEAEFEEIEARRYMVNVDALDEEENIIFNGQEDLDIDKGEHKDIEVELVEVP